MKLMRRMFRVNCRPTVPVAKGCRGNCHQRPCEQVKKVCLSQTIGLHFQHDLFLSPGDPLLWDPWGIRSPDD